MNRVRGISPNPQTTTTNTSAGSPSSPPKSEKRSSISGKPTPAKTSSKSDKPQVKMSLGVVGLLVYTVGVKCRGINKKEEYAPEHIFSLSENTANKILKEGMVDLIKHNRTHVVRIYPKGTRLSSTNYEPHRYWAAGAQLVAINWQTCGGFFFSLLCDICSMTFHQRSWVYD